MYVVNHNCLFAENKQ